MADRRYWVIGGNDDCLDFKSLKRGTQTLIGPFEREEDAKSEWKRISSSTNRW